jgi:hypothetical protein
LTALQFYSILKTKNFEKQSTFYLKDYALKMRAVMSQQISLRNAERKVFQATYNDGLWDIFLGCFFLMFVIGPYLSTILGDFWSSVAFLPFWGLVYLAIWLVKKCVVEPRIGIVKFGVARKTKLGRFIAVMLVINVVAVVLGLIAAMNVGRVPGQIFPIIFGLILLISFSLAAYLLDFGRLYIYGLLLGLSPLIGEWLWTHGYAAHHGLPITFGISTFIMIIVGLVIYLRLLHDNPVPEEEIPSGKA